MRHSTKRGNAKRNRRGAAAVEFALVFPLIMSFFGAMVMFAQANLLRDTAQHAAYEGARAAMVPGASSEDAKAAAESLLAVIDTRAADIKITPPVITDDVPTVRVDVVIPMGPNLWWMGATPFTPEKWELGSSITLNREVGGAG